ncbi:MAG: UV DNA damage repair endonuclease UvsE [Clostridiaceae bacterium]|nr:UV DNA damage repair endonuclease UvsE [Clostridiaceae bacterium]
MSDYSETRDHSRLSDDRPRIGYACVTVGVPGTRLRTLTRRFASGDKLHEIIDGNLDALEKQAKYNIENGIRMFRISSDIIPFAGTPINPIRWETQYAKELARIGRVFREGGIRVSMHPGQYTVLNSPDSSVVEKSICDLSWHADFLDALGVSFESKIVLHIGGGYGDRVAALRRFSDRYRTLPKNVRDRLVIENDERIFSIEDALVLYESIGTPVVYDNLHREVFEKRRLDDHADMIRRCARTFQQTDGRQKIHYSLQDPNKKAGAHSATVRIDEFMEFFRRIRDGSPDIMLEVKDKNLSAIKCALLTSGQPDRKLLEKEWSRYKYTVMERSPSIYSEIRTLFSSTGNISAESFYRRTEDALSGTIDPGKAENAALHVWGYFSGKATEREKALFFNRLAAYRKGAGSLSAVKKHLFRMAETYREDYLLNSLYFYL